MPHFLHFVTIHEEHKLLCGVSSFMEHAAIVCRLCLVCDYAKRQTEDNGPVMAAAFAAAF